ncbi:MAG TPA: polymer-forming cytoskeletal protein [Gammaproteobacteria bacterium]
MFGKDKKSNAKIDTLIGQNTEIRGDVVFSGGLHVDGVIKGNVTSAQEAGSLLSLSERGRIEGEVRVSNLMLNGTVIGDVHSGAHIELAPKARINGNLYYKVLEMAGGSEVNGSLVRRGNEVTGSEVVAASEE